MPQIVWTADPTAAPTYYNARWFEYTGRRREQARRGRLDAASCIPTTFRGAIATRRRDARVAARRSRPSTASARADGAYRWHLGRAVPIRDADGAIDFWVGTATDIHDQQADAAGAALPRSRRARCSARSLDYRDTLEAVAELAVPAIADWCAVDVVEADGVLRQLALAHADPAEDRLRRELQERYPPNERRRCAGA